MMGTGTTPAGATWRTLRRLVFAAALSAAVANAVVADTVRANVAHTVTVQTNPDFQTTAEVALGELIALDTDATRHYLQSIAIELTMNNQLKEYHDSFGLTIYTGASPPPQQGVQTLQAERLLLTVLPYRNRFYVTIPLAQAAADRSTGADIQADAVVTRAIPTTAFPLLISVQPLMKGIPQSALDHRFFLRITPRVADRGTATLAVTRPSGTEAEAVELLVDGKPITGLTMPLELPAGFHELQARSSFFQDTAVMFVVSPAQNTAVAVPLTPRRQQIRLELPDTTEVVLDGELLDFPANKSYELNEGEHTVILRVGDYSVSRRFRVARGQSYTVSLTFAVNIGPE